jgi:hypothetical protein
VADEAKTIDDFLSKRGSPMTGLGNVFVAAGRKYGVDPRLLVSISGAESSFGKFTSGAHNAWGWGPGIPFSSWEEGISKVAQGLRSGYLNQGLRTPGQIAAKWAPVDAGNDPTDLNSNWTGNVESFMRDLGGAAPLRSTRRVAATTAAPPMAAAAATTLPPPADFGPVIAANVGRSPELQVRNLVDAMIASEAPTSRTTSSVRAAERSRRPTAVPRSGGGQGRALLSAGANRPGVSLHPAVVDFVKQISGVYGQPLTIGTGTAHNQFVLGTNRESAHWTGWAADVPMGGSSLTRLGQDALIAAGMNPAKARQQKGGLFNIGPYQIIFNSMIGGNHFNHLHVGLSGRHAG